MMRPWTTVRLLIPILWCGFSLRIIGLGRESLWYDETVSAFLAAKPVFELIAHTARDIHPPAYYILLHGWSRIAGHSEFALAYLSLLFGLLLIPLTARLAHYLLGRNVTIWAALLVAVSPYHIWYSQEVRMYTQGAVLGLVAAICALYSLNGKEPAWRYWTGYVLAATIGLYALYYFSFLLIALNLLFLGTILWPALDTGRLRAWLVANALIVLAYLPWLPIAWQQATSPPVPPWRSLPAPANVVVEAWTALSLGQSVTAGELWPILLLTALLVGLGILYTQRQAGGRTTAFLLVYAFGPGLLIYLVSFLTPLYHVRYLFIYAPAFQVLLGAGMAWLAHKIRWWAAVAAALILIMASLYAIYLFHTDPELEADDYQAAVEFIDDQWQPGDALLANAGYIYTAIDYYTTLPGLERQRLVPYSAPTDPNHPLLLQTGSINGNAQLGWGDPGADFYTTTPAETIAALEQMAGGYPRLWMLRAYDTVTDPDGVIRDWLTDHATLIEDRIFSGESNIRVQGFLLTTTLTDSHQVSVPFADGMSLVSWQLPGHIWQPGQSIPVKLWWTATSTPSVDYKMSLKLWAADGTLMAQGRDNWPGGTLFRATHWSPGTVVYQPTQLQLPPSLPPGEYWLNVELYHPDTIQPLPRIDDVSSVVTLGPVRVESSPVP